MNHLAKNLLTKGFLNTSVLTKGIIEVGVKIIVYRKRGGTQVYDRDNYLEGLKKIGVDDISHIKVQIDWYKKKSKAGKFIYAEQLKNTIEAELITEFKTKLEITVELL